MRTLELAQLERFFLASPAAVIVDNTDTRGDEQQNTESLAGECQQSVSVRCCFLCGSIWQKVLELEESVLRVLIDKMGSYECFRFLK